MFETRWTRLDFTFGPYPADGWCQQPGAHMRPVARDVNGMPDMRDHAG